MAYGFRIPKNASRPAIDLTLANDEGWVSASFAENMGRLPLIVAVLIPRSLSLRLHDEVGVM